jgi:hypothetical protein
MNVVAITPKENPGTGKIRAQYKHCLTEILKHFSVSDSTSPKVVHDLRVNLKRIDALRALLRFSHVNVSRSEIKAFKSLFNIAGKLRSVQVEFDTIKKYFDDESLNPNYLHELHEKKAKRLKKYVEFLEEGPSRSLKHGIKLLKKKVGKLTTKQISHYLQASKKSLSKKLRRSVFREQELHLIRKDVKRYYLNQKICSCADHNIEKLLDLLGVWHDHQITFDHVIKTIHTGRLAAAENESIIKIKYELISDKEALYEKIVSFYSTEFLNHKNLVTDE